MYNKIKEKEANIFFLLSALQKITHCLHTSLVGHGPPLIIGFHCFGEEAGHCRGGRWLQSGWYLALKISRKPATWMACWVDKADAPDCRSFSSWHRPHPISLRELTVDTSLPLPALPDSLPPLFLPLSCHRLPCQQYFTHTHTHSQTLFLRVTLAHLPF